MLIIKNLTNRLGLTDKYIGICNQYHEFIMRWNDLESTITCILQLAKNIGTATQMGQITVYMYRDHMGMTSMRGVWWSSKLNCRMPLPSSLLNRYAFVNCLLHLGSDTDNYTQSWIIIMNKYAAVEPCERVTPRENSSRQDLFSNNITLVFRNLWYTCVTRIMLSNGRPALLQSQPTNVSKQYRYGINHACDHDVPTQATW